MKKPCVLDNRNIKTKRELIRAIESHPSCILHRKFLVVQSWSQLVEIMGELYGR